IELMDLGLALGLPPGSFTLQPTSVLDLKATFSDAVGARAGLVYAYFTSGYYKFAALYADTQQVVLGHYTTKGGFKIDASANYTVTPGTKYTLELTANGNAVTLTVNGAPALSFTYNTVVSGGKFGLVTLKGAA